MRRLWKDFFQFVSIDMTEITDRTGVFNVTFSRSRRFYLVLGTILLDTTGCSIPCRCRKTGRPQITH